MDRDHESSLKTWLAEILAALCPANIAHVISGRIDGEPARIEIRVRDQRGGRRPRD